MLCFINLSQVEDTKHNKLYIIFAGSIFPNFKPAEIVINTDAGVLSAPSVIWVRFRVMIIDIF